MSKAKIRKITVENQNYTWASGKYNSDGDGCVVLTIWQNRKIIKQKLFHGVTITPKMVREEIINQ